jgi:Tol biopolymer transport system component
MLDLAADSVRKIVSQPGPDNGPRWSPDGKQIVFSSAMGREPFFAHEHSPGDRARRRRYAQINPNNGHIR